MTLLFADEARGWLPASLVSMGLMSQRWSILVATILLLKKSLVQNFEAPLAGFTRIGRESFEKRLEVPSTSRVTVGLKALGVRCRPSALGLRRRQSGRSQSLWWQR